MSTVFSVNVTSDQSVQLYRNVMNSKVTSTLERKCIFNLFLLRTVVQRKKIISYAFKKHPSRFLRNKATFVILEVTCHDAMCDLLDEIQCC